MRKRLLCLILSAVLALGIAPTTSLAKTADGPDYGKPGTDYVEGEAIVCIKGKAASSMTAKRNSSFQMETLMKIKPDQGAGARTASLSSPEKSLVLVTSDKKDTKTLIETFEKDPNVEYAEPNYIMKAYGAEPSDPGYDYQWALNNQENKGQSAANPAVDGNFKEAWSNSTTPSDPSKNPVVAVIDSGVDYNHPDLENVMWDDGLNIPALKEMGGGKYGYNARSATDVDKKENPSTDPMDTDVGHGTHCAGIIAAEWNSEGVAGVNSNVEIMALRFLGLTNAGSVSDALKCYAYVQTAVEKGVNVTAINNSWGPNNYDDYELRSISTAANAIGEQYGVVSCFAAGNDGVDLDKNTGSLAQGPYIINVGAMDSTGSAACFSQYGRENVDVFAPGTQILSTTTTNTEQKPMEEHDMPTQYLPQIMNPGDSWFYEDFESSKDDQVSLQLLDKNGNVVVSAAEALSPGYTSGKGLRLSLDDIEEGENFFIEMTLPASATSGITKSNSVYLAFQAGCDNAMYGESFDIQYQNASNEWKTLYSTELVDGEFYPARLRLSDHNWNQATLQIADTSFLTSRSDPVTLRLTPRTKKMQGRQEGKAAAFRLDDVGLGKKASNYYYSDGTSMAAPMVTGLAGLLASNGYEGEEIAARIKGGVNRTEAQSLENKSISDGFIDAAAALDTTKCVPVLNNLSVNGDTASLTGYFFGNAQGTLTIGGKTAAVSKWSDHQITFQIPDGIRGKREVRVVRSGTNASTNYGKNYFSLSPDTIGYKALSAPKLTYGSYDGKYQFTSEDLFPISMAAAGGKVAWLGMLQEENQFFLELYDVATDTWEKASLPEDLQVIPNLTEEYQLAGGKEKLYLSYWDMDNIIRIGVYDTKSKTWRTVKTELPGLEALAVYGDQLIAAGGQEDDGALTDVRVIDPGTGKVIGSLPNLPEARAGANLRASGNLLILYGGYDDYMAKLLGTDYTQYANALVYDGTKWTVNQSDFFSAEFEGFDKEQTLDYAVGATNGGLLVAGPVQNWETEKGIDTWAFNYKTGNWTAREDVLYSQYKTTCDLGVTYEGAFYVRSRGDLEENPVVFRALTNVDHTGPTGEPAKDQPSDTPPTPTTPATSTNKPGGTQTIAAAQHTANANALNKKVKVAWSKNKLKTTWGKVNGATGYEVYAAVCGNKYTKVKTIKGAKKTTCTIKKIKGKKLRSTKAYKVAVKAYRMVNGKKQYIGTSLSMYTVGKSNKTYTNPKRLKATKKSVTLRTGKSKKIKVKVTKQSSKKKLLKASYVAKLRYFSTNTKVATVTKGSGIIKAKSKGSCTIYAVGANGVKTKIKVRVK